MKKLDIFPNYKNRSQRNQFIAKLLQYNKYNNNLSILNISGGGNLELKKILQKKDYMNVLETDIVGDFDQYLNLENDNFPFEKNTFDIVIATDVLEHLDNFHETLENLFDTSKSALIISLPNSFNSVLNILKNKKNTNPVQGLFTKYYGLPIDKPSDRHKWWITNEDTLNFFLNFEKNKNVKIKYFFHQINKSSIKYFLIKLIFGKRISNLIFQNSIWLIIEK